MVADDGLGGSGPYTYLADCHLLGRPIARVVFTGSAVTPSNADPNPQATNQRKRAEHSHLQATGERRIAPERDGQLDLGVVRHGELRGALGLEVAEFIVEVDAGRQVGESQTEIRGRGSGRTRPGG